MAAVERREPKSIGKRNATHDLAGDDSPRIRAARRFCAGVSFAGA
jgi:hypothetical protein